MTCIFFGHRHTPSSIFPVLKATIVNLIENRNVDRFIVGNQGDFDLLVSKALREIKNEYPHIDYMIMLAYMPTSTPTDAEHTVFPEGLESVPSRFAIYRRNEIMVKQADIAIVYVLTGGGAEKFTDMLRKRKTEIINIAELNNLSQ